MFHFSLLCPLVHPYGVAHLVCHLELHSLLERWSTWKLSLRVGISSIAIYNLLQQAGQFFIRNSMVFAP